MSSPIVASLDGVSKRFSVNNEKSVKETLMSWVRRRDTRRDFWALRDISMDIAVGDTVGFVGHNGSGKSTLLKLIGGILEPSEGKIVRRGRLAALLELGAGFHPDLSGRENIFLNASIMGLSRAETLRNFDDIVAFSGIEDFIDTQVKFYSSGMHVRLGFAVAVHVDPDVLLVDEVLAVGDEPFQKKCLARIEQFQNDGRTIAFVSHAAEQVRSICDRVVVLDHGRMVHDGTPDDSLRILHEGYLASATASAPAIPIKLHDVAARVSGTRGKISMAIEVPVTVEPGASDWRLTVDLTTVGGLALVSLDTAVMGITMSTSLGGHVVRIYLDDVRINPGEYTIRAKAHDHQNRWASSEVESVCEIPGTVGEARGPLSVSARAEVAPDT